MVVCQEQRDGRTFFKLFDSKIAPIMLYGSELWALKQVKCLETLHLYACKRFLNVKPKACNDSILGDLGRFPMYIYAFRRCMKYWLRVLSMPGHRYVKLCYDMLVYYDTIGHKNWVSDVKLNLYSNGFGYIWESQDNFDHKLFILEYEQRLKDQYIQCWRQRCQENSKLNYMYYINFKHVYTAENYVKMVDVSKFRRCLANFRCCAHNLMVEEGRYIGLFREQRTCPYCETCVEDEYHFMLVCPLYSHIRSKYLSSAARNVSVFLFHDLMSSENVNIVRNVAMYIFYAMLERDNYLNIYV